MKLSAHDKILIKEMHIHKGYNVYQLMTEFSDKGWEKSILYWFIRQLDATVRNGGGHFEHQLK